MEIKEKLEKDEKTLKELKQKRNELNDKIKNLEENIKYNTMLLSQKKFNEVKNVISSKGLSIEEILKAVQNGDLLSLQTKMEQMNNPSANTGNR